jgi:serine phosphatase RsbU (regulator of sigma subunit)/anti-sigma regulatory factor (Ser/Thr protein kinase)/putative methionine-R-sulfoxide reductase with GAF domain
VQLEAALAVSGDDVPGERVVVGLVPHSTQSNQRRVTQPMADRRGGLRGVRAVTQRPSCCCVYPRTGRMQTVTPDSRAGKPHRRFAPRTGQTVLAPVGPELAPSHQAEGLYRLSDPALSELGLEEFLDELLVRVREALTVDTVAILLYDPETDQLVARAAKGIEEEVEAGVRIPIGQGFAGRIAAERVAVFIPDVDHADILNPILREKGIRSLLGIPLIVEGQLIGVLHVGSLHPRTFGQRDLAVLQVAAARAAPGIERARLYSALEREHRVAMVLQRSLLPKRLVDVVGVQTAARYLPATDEVGGDWYDVFELARGRLGVAIGDVVGHGVRAAALMGQLRTALHAYAMQDYGPARTLELVDRYVQAMPEYAMATAAYGVLEPDTGEVQIASAGHLPPVVIDHTGGRVVEISPSAPLGAFSYGRVQEQRLSLRPGETLVLYTDGLIERPGIPLNESIEALVSVVHGSRSVEDLVRLAVERMVPVGALRDDVAIVAIQNNEISDELRLQLRADPTVLAEIRHVLRRWLRHQGADDSQTLEITLAVSEACTNAIEHAYSPAPAQFSLSATAREGMLTFIVSDGGRWRPPRGQDRGRGLTIIRAAMDDVEVNSSETGTDIVMRRRIAR